MTVPRVVCIVQARLASRRLTRKCLVEIQGKPMIVHVVERALAVEDAHVVLATTRADQAEFIAAVEGRCDVVAYDIPEDDVLGRFRRVAREYLGDVYVRVTGDCPLFAPDVATAVLRTLIDERRDFVWNDTRSSGYGDGFDVQVFTDRLLRHADRDATTSTDREHATDWMQRNARHAALLIPESEELRWPDLKVSVDTAEDLDRVRATYAHLKPGEYTYAATLAAARKAEV